ncbi:hypothetical protein [Micromonospora sp. NBC_01412]|uniref:hypothetical protein n=1 Tax=Micromonospora sp. NBC_01412 TaxID=2903590 RepID=UPI00386D4F04
MRAGDVLHVTRAASPQFVTPIFFRLIRVMSLPTYHGWSWLEGYQLDERGDAVARRELFVQPAGLRKLSAPSPRKARQPLSRGRREPGASGRS